MSKDLAWADLPALRAMLDARQIGGVELLQAQLDHAQGQNASINAICEWDLERAHAAARAFDQGRRSGGAGSGGELAGIPMTVKESFDVADLHTTRGVPAHRERVASTDGTAVARLRSAGAIIFGKTNVPYNLADYQSFNDIYGATVNPWDSSRTPGGSSGGSAAALAAGMTPLELGGDLGGSIRVPAHCCGVFGHRPTPGVVPFGRYAADNPLPPVDVAVAGPMARSASSLRTLLSVLAGPDAMQARGWSLRLPPARVTALADFRVGVWLDVPGFPVDERVRVVLENFVQGLERAGARVHRIHPEVEPAALHGLYLRLIRAATSLRPPPGDLERQRAALDSARDPEAEHELRGVFMSHREWLADDEARHCMRWLCTALFDGGVDVILCPVLAVTAFAHQHGSDLSQRTWEVNGQQHQWRDRTFWCALSGVAGLPATVMPAGIASDGLPVGVQILGAPFDDLTTIAFAAAAEEAVGGFSRPPALKARNKQQGDKHG